MWNLITFSFERILLLLLLQLVTLQNGSAKLIQNHAEDSRIAIEEEEEEEAAEGCEPWRFGCRC